MFRVFGCVFGQHDLRLVVLAGIVCFFACVTAMSMLARARAAEGRVRLFWLGAAGAVAGCGIWGTHFIAMLAYQTGFPVAYEPGLTLLSVALAVVLCSCGFFCSLGRPGPIIGGAITGAAIAVMHYVGMAAVRAPAIAVWDVRYVISSAVIGIALMSFGMRFAFGRNHLRGYLLSGLIFTLAICSLHFTAMTAVVFNFDPRVIVPEAVLAPLTLAIAVAAVAALVIAFGFIGAMLDYHLALRASDEAQRLRIHVAELEETKTALVQSSQNLARALAAADAANLAKSQFLATMSHELRTPLNAVIGFSEALMLEMFGPLGHGRYKEYAADINSSGAHLLSLINDILDLSRLDVGAVALKDELVDLDKLIGDALKMVSPLAFERRVALLRGADDQPLSLKVDSRRLRQVLINLLSNAVKFTPDGGTVSVETGRDAGELVIRVRDTGIGIAEEDIPRAFHRFGQLDSTLARKYEGAGLGLPLAKDLVELHGGSLTLTSEVGRGTTVILRLPASRIATAQDSAAAA
jgi:signal transduction histidine kinase